jgi:hypothetical protein
MTTSSATPRRSTGRLFLFLGLALGVLGVAAYVVQVANQWLKAPWYLPILATLGVLLLVASLWQRRTVWRVLALILLVLLAGFEWTFLLGTRLPAYAGPVKQDEPFPAFETKTADGKPFTQRQLQGDKDAVMVFFRGRW